MPPVFVIRTMSQKVASPRPSGQSLGMPLGLNFFLMTRERRNDDGCLAMGM